MATSSVSSTNSAVTTAADVAAANRANAQKILTSMSAGSGVDVNALAQNLVDAERVPQENAINAKITNQEKKISGYSALSFALSNIKDKFNVLKVKSDFNTLTVNSSGNSAFNVVPGAYASPADYEINVESVAKPQRTLSGGFAQANQSLNAGDPFSLSLSINGAAPQTIAVAAANATPLGVVDAINSAGMAVKAQLVTLGAGTSVATTVTLPNVTLANPPTDADFGALTFNLAGRSKTVGPVTPTTNTLAGWASALQTAMRTADGGNSDLSVSVAANGKDLVFTDALGRNVSNFALSANGGSTDTATVINGRESDKAYKIMLTGNVGSTSTFSMSSMAANGSAVPGLYFDNTIQKSSDASLTVNGIHYMRSTNKIDDILSGSTLTLKAPTTSAAVLSLERDTSSVKTKLKDLVAAYNDAQSIFKEVSNPKSTFDTFGATLVSDSLVRRLQQQTRSMFLSESSTPGSQISALWQLGISVTQTGELDLDESKLDNALASNYDDMVRMFTGNKNLYLSTGTDNSGIAGDAMHKISALLGTGGPILQQSENANTQISKYKDDLIKLQTRMDSLLTRYKKQFGVMDSLVGQTNSMKTSLKSSFDGMMSVYTNK